jgi:hypothetical protein
MKTITGAPKLAKFLERQPQYTPADIGNIITTVLMEDRWEDPFLRITGKDGTFTVQFL